MPSPSSSSSINDISIASGPAIKVVESDDERFKAMLVRAIVYMHEQQCPFSEEFDLNDYTATQILGTGVDGEPIMTARIRYFGNFAKIERIAIRMEYRGRGYAHKLLNFVLNLCRQKGYSRFYLHAQQRLRSFYESYGFRVVGGDFSFSSHEYLEMVLDGEATESRPESYIGTAPMLLNRPENNMHRSGPLEHAGSRHEIRHSAYKGDAQ